MSQQIFSKLANTYAENPEEDKMKFVKKKTGCIDDIKVTSKCRSEINMNILFEIFGMKQSWCHFC